MAFALGFAGGFADDGVEPEPEPQPGVIGRGSGSPLYRTRWVARPGQPAPPPVRIAVAVHVAYRWSAVITRLTFGARLVQVAPCLSFRVAALKTYVRTLASAAKTTAKVVDVKVDPVTVSQFAYEVRELTEIAVALTAWQQAIGSPNGKAHRPLRSQGTRRRRPQR